MAMAWFEDLKPCTYFGDMFAHRLKAIGWLAKGRAFPTGETSVDVFEKLCCLCQDPWAPVATAGVHLCELRQFTGGGTSSFKDYRISGVSNGCLFVPGDGFLYVAPCSLPHIIDAHSYRPSEAFCTAVQYCPEMRSMAYLKAVLANGGGGFKRLGA
jgi:hypothetical protein